MDLRRELRGLIKQGKTDAEIKEFMVSRYGDFVLVPPTRQAQHLVVVGGSVRIDGCRYRPLFVYLRRRNTDIGPGGLTEEERKRADALLQEGEK
jgi:cytochrome c-type biogenesis protein CcmH